MGVNGKWSGPGHQGAGGKKCDIRQRFCRLPGPEPIPNQRENFLNQETKTEKGKGRGSAVWLQGNVSGRTNINHPNALRIPPVTSRGPIGTKKKGNTKEKKNEQNC